MEGRYGFSEGFPEGKSEGWNGRPMACHPRPGGVQAFGMSFHPDYFYGGKSWGKPIPSWHWLIRITFHIALEWYEFYACSLGSMHEIHIISMLYKMLFLSTNVRKAPPLLPWGRPSAYHSIPLTFPQEIPRKTHTFPPLVNKNIPFSI